MAFSYAKFLVLLAAAASMLAAGQAATVVVGGSEHWRYGFNYTDWALQHGPFYQNDKLVFKYDPPSGNSPPHTVYLLPSMGSFINCDFRSAQLLANVTQGSGDGFGFVLTNNWRPLYFACGEEDGKNCKEGLMKFFAVPLPRRS
ncbi:uncharacterized protein LOC132277758 [Cornus florida]|uniref:uncharacterized protein LOC132277758 n=1 Tax=Cornus florida TaxID=4283 RepID=UPI0028A05768|nr:uncharacterized protein LOC132277758 [Cornus florida]